jgi:hypothetical protein
VENRRKKKKREEKKEKKRKGKGEENIKRETRKKTKKTGKTDKKHNSEEEKKNKGGEKREIQIARRTILSSGHLTRQTSPALTQPRSNSLGEEREEVEKAFQALTSRSSHSSPCESDPQWREAPSVLGHCLMCSSRSCLRRDRRGRAHEQVLGVLRHRGTR